MSGATKQISPPQNVPLDERDMSFWDSVLQEYARADWTFHQLELAAMLARTMSNLEEEQRLLRQEGGTITKEFTNPDGSVRKILTCPNLRARAVQEYMGQVLSLRRSLALHVRGKTGGNLKDSAAQREHNKDIEAKAEKGNDELLA